MRINDFNKTITAQRLNESAARQFGQKLNLENFSTDQLYDARNKLRTELSQFESVSYSEVLESDSYHKSKLFLDVLNQAIDERESYQDPVFTEMEELVLDKVSEGLLDFDVLPAELRSKVIEAASDQVFEAAPEGWEGTVKGMKKHKDITNPWALAHWMKGKGYKSHKKESMKEGIIREGEEEKAELIMSARNMVDKVTNWMEDTAQMQTEVMLDLVDHIRDELGLEQSQEFESVVKPALVSIYSALESARENLNQGVGLLTGEAQVAPSLGAEPEMGADVDSEDMTDIEGDDFEASAPAAGGDEEAGRMKRESIEFGRKLGILLTSKKK
jgi:hypothetical protein